VSKPMYLVSTFTSEFFRGNPAAVVMLEDEHETAWYERIAQVLNQPATAFLRPIATGFALRWFSATRELPLCGHGTLAAAHVLYETRALPAKATIELATQAGALPVRRDDDITWISLEATAVEEAPAPGHVLEALGLLGAEWYGAGEDDLVVLLDSVAAVEAVRPDFDRLWALPQTRTIVTAAGGAGVDFTSRVFPPRVGVTEDQVTGTAHCALGPFWSQRLGRTRLTARQASGRGGLIELDLSRGDRVEIGGKAVTVARGDLLGP
jgi:PhzF family phenazine biosynthesis protein